MINAVVQIAAVTLDALFLAWQIYLPLLRRLLQARSPLDDGWLANNTLAWGLTAVVTVLFANAIYRAYGTTDDWRKAVLAVALAVGLFHFAAPWMMENRLTVMQADANQRAQQVRNVRASSERHERLDALYLKLDTEQDMMMDLALAAEVRAAQRRSQLPTHRKTGRGVEAEAWVNDWMTCSKDGRCTFIKLDEGQRGLMRVRGDSLLEDMANDGIGVNRDYGTAVKAKVEARRDELTKQAATAPGLNAPPPVPPARLDYLLNVVVGLLLTLLSAYARFRSTP